MLKVNIVVGTRPEIIRLSETIKLCQKIFQTTLIHTGQNYDYKLNEVFFNDLDLKKPDVYLNCDMTNVGTSVGSIIQQSYDYFSINKPDCILLLGDTNSCLCAYSAKRLKIPIFHIEAGNRCFDKNVPEEINRKIIDHISDINICYTEHAKLNLFNEGLAAKYIFVVGSPIREVINSIEVKIKNNKILEQLELKEKEYFVISVHREENININNNFEKVIKCINNVSKCYDKKIIFSVHPRTRKMINEKKIVFDKNVILCEPFGLIDYCNLQKNSKCVISDSGTVTEESSILQFPAILLRTSTERPEGIDSGNIIICGIEENSLIRNINMALQNKYNEIIYYTDTNFSQKVGNIITGHVDIINKYIWMK